MRYGKVMQRKHTAWHSLYVRLLRAVLPRSGFTVRSEVQLSQQPLRIDTVVVRRTQLPPPPLDSPLRMGRLFYEAR